VPELEWWTHFGDTALDHTVDSAFASNFNLVAAWYRLLEAQSVAGIARSDLFPELALIAQGETGSGQSAFQVNDNIRTGLVADYELDLWGRVRSSVKAEKFRADAELADFRAATISLSAEIVLTWYRLAEAQKQMDIAREQMQTNEKVLSLIRARFGSGQTRSVDIFRQAELVEASRERLIARETEVNLLKNQLSVLTGNPPNKLSTGLPDELPVLPELPATGIPVELVERRPDVRAAWFRLKAADRDLASAISSRYPRLSFSAEVVSQGAPSELFREWAWSVSGNLLAPLFYGGRLRAEVDRNEAIKNQRLYEYGQAVLVSFREVEDSLVREANQVKSIESLERQLALATRSYEQLQLEYLNGISNYLDVLTALDQEQQLRRNLLAARLELIEFRVALYRALAGGFDLVTAYTQSENENNPQQNEQ